MKSKKISGFIILLAVLLFPQFANAGELTDAQCSATASGAICKTKATFFTDGCTGTETSKGDCTNSGTTLRGCCAPSTPTTTTPTATTTSATTFETNCINRFGNNGTWRVAPPPSSPDTAAEAAACTAGGGTVWVCVPSADRYCINGTNSTGTSAASATATTPAASAGATGFAYKPLEQIPGAKGVSGFPQYVQGIYKFGIWTVGLAALFMLSVGGFIYLSSGGNTATISKAKTYIWDALIGLILALLAWLILFVINPDLVAVNLGSFSKVGGSVPQSIESISELPPEVQKSVYPGNVALNELNKNGIYAKSSGVCAGETGCVNYTAPNVGCATQKLGKCTSLEGIPQHAVFGLINLKAAASAWWAKKIGVPGTKCDFMVTGGTEVGHKSHGPGKAAVDVSEAQCLGEFLASEVNSVGSKGIKKICTRGGTTDANGNAKAIPAGVSSYIVNAKLACEYQEESPHYHIQF